jgi:hypothetical protein
MQICKFYMDKGCENQSCTYVHDPLLCQLYWVNGKCITDNCQYHHNYINKFCNVFNKYGKCTNNKCKYIHKINKKNNNDRIQKKKKNTECFEPLNRPVDLKLSIDTNHEFLSKQITDRELLLVPNVFNDFNKLDIYNNLVYEIETCGIDLNNLLKMWHGNDKFEGTHYICDDKLSWKKHCPTFNLVIQRLIDYFNVDVQSTRLNWYKDTNQWKPFHHDAAAIDPVKAEKQNVTIAVSFGCKRSIGLESGEDTKFTRKIISFDQDDGEIYVFTNKTNELWRHGILQEKDYKDEGRISIIVWGKINNIISL